MKKNAIVLEKRLEQYQQAYESMLHQLREMNRQRFGSKSERFVDDRQLSLFPEPEAAENVPAVDETVTVPEHQRAKKKGKKDWKNLPREIVIIPVSDGEKACACGSEKSVIRYEVKEMLDYQPATLRVIEERREMVACPKGCEGSLCVAPVKPHVLPKVGATENLLAAIIVSKLHDRQPLYLLEKHHHRVSRETMARWAIALMSPLQPIFNLLKDPVIDYDVGSLDATTWQVLSEPDRRAQKKSHIYSMRGGPPGKEVVLYGYVYDDHSGYIDNWFEGFKGTLHMDAANVCDRLLKKPGVTAALCNAHPRRKFEAIKKQAKKQGLAHEALRFYKQLYAIERKAKEANMTPEQRYALRQRESKPLLEKFKQWMEEAYATVLPKSPLGQAFEYCLKENRWADLTRFLDDGRLEIDNNLQEQEIKPLVMVRKNCLFSNSMDGARALCLHMSLIRTALHHGLKPYEYYVALLKQLPYCKTVEDYEKLLPWNIFKA
ncbi:MAG: IS66 family transposase [Proteobacteria bacterium]|nr:IS66 family transposase [Pseudomonadota bacterium]